MKTLIAAALLLTLASPASAGGSDAKWDCGQGITALAGKGEFGFHMGKAYKEDGYPRQGSVKWDFRLGRGSEAPEIWLNGKACKRTN